MKYDNLPLGTTCEITGEFNANRSALIEPRADYMNKKDAEKINVILPTTNSLKPAYYLTLNSATIKTDSESLKQCVEHDCFAKDDTFSWFQKSFGDSNPFLMIDPKTKQTITSNELAHQLPNGQKLTVNLKVREIHMFKNKSDKNGETHKILKCSGIELNEPEY